MSLVLVYVLVGLLQVAHPSRRLHGKLALKNQGPDRLGFQIKESTRKEAFEKIWEEVQEDITSGDKDSGLGLFPHVATAFPAEYTSEKIRRYRDNFVPAYNKVIFLPRHPVVTGINFFALLSEEEKGLYLGANLGNQTIRPILQKLAPNDLNQYDLEQEEGYEGAKETFFHHELHQFGGFSEEYVNFTHEGEVTARNTGGHLTAGLFSALNVLESVYRLKTLFTRSDKKVFSRQFLVDCLHRHHWKITNWFPHEVYKYLHKLKNLPLESDLPYTGNKHSCKDDKKLDNAMNHAVEVVSSKVSFPTERGMMDHFKSSGPVSVCIHVNDHIFYYQSGMSNECVAGIHCNHFVTLLAYRKDFFTVENSWGKKWGLQGRMNMLRMNCAENPSGSRYFVTSVTLTIVQTEEEEIKDEAIEKESHQGNNYTTVMMRESLINNKDYWFQDSIQVGDVVVVTGKSIQKGMQSAYVSLFETASDVNIPYHIVIDENHQAISQTYLFGHTQAQFPKLIEKLHQEDIDEDETVISIEFTRTFIQTRINDKALQIFYHQADIQTIGSFEVHGPVGWFKSMKHLRVKLSG